MNGHADLRPHVRALAEAVHAEQKRAMQAEADRDLDRVRLIDERDAYDRLAKRLAHREEAIAALTAERDRLARQLDAERSRSASTSAALDRTLEARDRLAAQVQRVRDHRDSYLGDDIVHTGCIDGSCNVCIADGITRALDGGQAAADDAAWDDAVEATAQPEDGAP